MTDSVPTSSWKRIAVVLIAGIISAVQVGLIAPAMPLLQTEFGLSLPFVSAVLSCITLISAIFGTVAGNWTNRFGLVRAIILGLVLMAIAAALSAIVTSGGPLLAIRAVSGVGYLLTVVACPPLIARLANDRDRSFALALWGSFLPMGIAVAEGVAAVLLDDIGWRGLFWVDAVALVATAVAAALLLRGITTEAASGATGMSIWTVYRMRAPLLLMVAFGIFALVFIVFAGVEPAYLTTMRGMSIAAAGRTIALTTLIAIPGSLLAGWLVRRGAAPMTLAWIGLIGPALFSIPIFLPGLALTGVIGATALAMALGAFVPASVYALIPRIEPDPKKFAPVNGLLMQIGSTGTLIGPPLFAAWSDTLGWVVAPVLLIVISAAAVLCLWGIRRHMAPVPAFIPPQ